MKSILLNIAENIIYLQLDRPEIRNAINTDMISEITDVFLNIIKKHNNKQLTEKFVVLSGSGKSFCAGADLSWMKSMAKYSFDENLKDSKKLYKMFEAIENCPIPVIGKVHGHVMGGALGLVGACDLVLCSKETIFCFSEVRIGLVPAVISSFILNKCNISLIKRWMITGEKFGSFEAQNAGLIHEIFSDENEYKEKFKKLKYRLLENGQEATSLTKKIVNHFLISDVESSKNFSCEAISKQRISQEGQEGMLAFFEKRKPSWSLK